MKKNNKRNVLLSLALGASVAFGAGLFAVNDLTSASAEISVNETTRIASEGFEMEAGASVRRVDTNGDGVNDQAGIRFATTVSADFQTYLSTTYPNATFEYGTLITAQNVLDQKSKTITDMTVENKDELQCNNPTDDVENGKFYGSVLYTSENGVDWAQLTDEQKLEIYKAELVGRGYVKVTKADETVEYIYAKAEDTVRSIRGVANAAIINGDGNLLNDYIGTAVREEQSFDYYDIDLKTGDIATELTEGTKYTAYVGAKLYGEVTVLADGLVQIKDLPALEVGEQSVSFFDESANVYSTPFVYPTKVLKTADDLAMFDLNNVYKASPEVNVKWDGYYVLGNDIDASAYTHKSIGYTSATTAYANVGLTGTFDGLGHKISNLTFGGNASQYNTADGEKADSYKEMDYSLFGLVCGGTIKNVGFVNVAFTGIKTGINSAQKGVLATQLIGANVENVYIQSAGLSHGLGSYYSMASGVACNIDENTAMTNCIFDIYDDGTVQTWWDKPATISGYTHAGSAAFGALTAEAGQYLNNGYANVTDRNWKNVFVISPLALTHEIPNASTHWEFFGSNLNKTSSVTADGVSNYENVTQYLSHDDMIAANIPYETLGFTADKGWKIVDGYAPTWNGVAWNKTVNYTVNLDAEKTQLSEDDLYALFNDKTATPVSASTTDSAYNLSYTDNKLAASIVAGDDWTGQTFTAVFSDGIFNVTATVRLCTEVITTAAELSVFCLDNTDYSAMAATGVTDDGRVPNKTITGYYALGNNIDAAEENYAMPTQGYIYDNHRSAMSSVGFQGTFDGCGYTISNMTFGTDQSADTEKYSSTNRTYWNKNTYSLFGIIGKNATVKNVALTNVQFALKNGTLALNMAACSALAMWIESGSTVENVYVSIKGIISWNDGSDALTNNVKSNASVAALAYGIYSGATLNNVVVDYTYSGNDVLDVTKKGSLVYRLCAQDTLSTIGSNVYVISGNPLAGSATANHAIYAQNDTTEGVTVTTGLYKYATLDDWKTAVQDSPDLNDFTSFDKTYWNWNTDSEPTVPTWKQ